MKFLKRFCLRLKTFFLRILNISIKESEPPQTIPDSIDRNERLVRGIFYPIHFKKKKVSENSFLPPSGRNDVSVLRHDYTTDDFCRTFFINMPSKQNYKGLFVLLAKHIEDISKTLAIDDKVVLKVTPLDEDKNPITLRPILVGFPGIPMHSDIVYNDKFANGEVQTLYREFARELVKKVDRYIEDPNLSSPTWEGPELRNITFPEI